MASRCLHDFPFRDEKADSWLCDPHGFPQQCEDGFNRKGYIRPLGPQDHLAAGTIKAQNIRARILGLLQPPVPELESRFSRACNGVGATAQGIPQRIFHFDDFDPRDSIQYFPGRIRAGRDSPDEMAGIVNGHRRLNLVERTQFMEMLGDKIGDEHP